MSAPNPPQLRVCGILHDGPTRYQIAYWRQRGPLFVQVGGCVVVPDRDLDRLIRGITDARKLLRAVSGRYWP